MMKYVATAWMVVLGLQGCCGEVTVMDDEGNATVITDDDGSSGTSSGSSGYGACNACADDDCGLCSSFGKNRIYRCYGDVMPHPTDSCNRLESVFEDQGGHYLCWQCPPP